MQETPRRFARLLEGRAVAEVAPLDGQPDVDGLVDEDALEVVGVDLEVGGRELDGRGEEAPAAGVDQGPARSSQAPVPRERDRRPRREKQRLADRREGVSAFGFEGGRRKHVPHRLRSGVDAAGPPWEAAATIKPMIRCLAAFVVVLAALAGGCGGEEGGLDRADGQAVFRATMRAVHEADWKTLESLLTKDARFALERDMRRLQTNLAAPSAGSELHARAKEALGEAYEAQVRAAVEGDLAAVLRFYVRAWPRARDPSPKALKLDSLQMEILYEAPGAVLRPVRLVRQRGRWFVQELHL